jgi:hypothetical protein
MERAELESKIEALRQDRGGLVLDGKKTTAINSSIEEAEAELAALADAEQVRIKRQRAQDVLDAAANRAGKLKRIAELEQKRLAAWADLEAASRALLTAIGGVIGSTEPERILCNDLTGATPMALGVYETWHRIRGRVGEFLHAAGVNFEVPGVLGIYGQAPLQDWREEERKALAAFITNLTTD